MMEKKKKINWFKVVLVFFFIVYIALYALNETGYYDGNIRRKVEFTESQIKEFEADIASGKVVDIESYLDDQNKNYTNNVSKLGYTVSKNVDDFLNKGIKNVLAILGKLLS